MRAWRPCEADTLICHSMQGERLSTKARALVTPAGVGAHSAHPGLIQSSRLAFEFRRRISRRHMVASSPARKAIALAVPCRPASGLVADRFGQIPFIAVGMVEVDAALRSAARICQLHPSRAIVREAACPARSRTGGASVAVAACLTVINGGPFHPGGPAVDVARPCSAPPSGHLARRGGTASIETQGKNTQGGWQRASGHCLAPNFRPPCDSIRTWIEPSRGDPVHNEQQQRIE